MKKELMKRNLVLKVSNMILFMAVLLFGGMTLSSCSGSPEATLKKIAHETQVILPQIMDEYTTMSDCVYVPESTLRFTYVVKNMQYDGSIEQKREMESAMKAVLIDRLKGRKELEFYLVNNIRFEHVFLDSSSKELLHINIEALDYK